MKVAKLMASNSHRCTLLRRYEAAAYQIANEPETMEESNEDDSAHVGVGNVSRDESFLSELEQKQEVLSRIIWKLIVMEMMSTLEVIKMGLKKMAREKGECTEWFFYCQ